MLRSRVVAVAAAAATVCAGVLVTGGSAFANDRDGHHPGFNGGLPLPAHVFAPYFETYNPDSLSGLSKASGAKFLTLAFLQTDKPGSCDVYWNGDTSTPVSWAVYGSDIAKIRAAGGDVVPSFGGYSADTFGTEIADSCTDVKKIAQVYENVITTYGVTRLDFDVESNPGSLSNQAGIDRRNKAIKLVEDWAWRTHRVVQFVYTLPTEPQGLESDGLNVLQNAVANHARVDIVNIMTFDYYDETSPTQTHEMATATITAANGLHQQLAKLYPHRSSSWLWRMIGVTEMPGEDDYGPQETFTKADAVTVERWAKSKGLAELSFWALQRDNGSCPGGGAQDTCSGIAQPTWYFSHVFEPFTSHRIGWWS